MTDSSNTPDTAGDIAFMTAALALVEARDLDAATALLAPDFRMHLAGLDEPMVGPEAWRGNTAYLLDAFDDLTITVDDAFTGDGRVVMLTTMAGTHVGEFLGVPATGRRAAWTSYEIYRVVDGRVTDEWICSDLFALVQQISG